MAGRVDSTSQHKAAKVAGSMFLLALIVPLLNWAFVLAGFITAGDAAATARNIMANELLFRTGLAVELFMAVGLVVLAVALYAILNPVSKYLALVALLLKLMEAATVGAIVLASFIALQVSAGGANLTAFTAEQLRVFIGLSLESHTEIYSIPMVILGLDMVIFCYLFLQSKYIPRMLAGFGILSFALVLIHALMFLLAPEYAAMPVNQIIFWVPSGLFEIAAGVWLLSKGLTIPAREEPVPEPA